MSICLTGEHGEHNFQFAHTKDGGDVFICMNYNCGETMVEPLDCTGG